MSWPGIFYQEGEKEMNETGTLYFFTGLAGAGKTTIGRLFYKHLKEKKDNVVIFDGDEIRRVMGDGLGYSMQDRLRSSLNRHFPLCRLLTEQGIDVVTCNISMFSQVRDWNRKHIQNYKEIYIKVSKETLYARDQKGLYSSGAKNVIGADLPFDEPKTPDIIIENNGDRTAAQIVSDLEQQLGLCMTLPPGERSV